MMQKTPKHCLKESIRLLLETSEKAVSEYTIIQHLNEQGWALSLAAADASQLFKTHFLVYHALYQLQVEYWQEQQRLLDITALKIGFIDHHHSSNSTSLPAGESVSYENHQALRAYYLDLSQLEQATTASVDELLTQFWSRFVASDDQVKALSLFDLPANTDSKTVKQRYRSLAMSHHPDRGGDSEYFKQINWAFGVLQKTIST